MELEGESIDRASEKW